MGRIHQEGARQASPCRADRELEPTH